MVNLAAPRGLWAAGLSLLVGRIAGGGHAVGLAPKSREGEMVMMVYIDDDEPMFVEQLTSMTRGGAVADAGVVAVGVQQCSRRRCGPRLPQLRIRSIGWKPGMRVGDTGAGC